MPTDPENVAHLLRRAGFGGTRAQIASLSALDLPQVVDAVLDTSGAPLDTPPVTMNDTVTSNWQQYLDLVHWWYERMASSPTPIVEKMTLFWHGHFTSSHDVGNNVGWTYDQNALFRRRALGDMHLLTQEMALQPLMLTYLSNRYNTKRGAQQNFARELMELFTVGLGNYTENDIIEVARAWTGHSVDWTTDLYVNHLGEHDTGLKTIFGETKNWDGPDVVDAIFTRDDKRLATARFMVTKLWTFFAYSKPDDTLVASLADVFLASNFVIAPLLRAMFLRPEFYSTTAKHGLVRSPVEYIVAVMRGTGISAADLHPEWYSDKMGQELFGPPNVAGWKNNSYWLTTSAMSARANLAEHVHYTLNKAGTHPLVNLGAKTPDQAIDIATGLLDVDVSTGTRQSLLDFVVNTRSATGHHWTESQLLILALLAPDFHVS